MSFSPAECHQRTRVWSPLTKDSLLPRAVLRPRPLGPRPLGVQPPVTVVPEAGLVRMRALPFMRPDPKGSEYLSSLFDVCWWLHCYVTDVYPLPLSIDLASFLPPYLYCLLLFHCVVLGAFNII